MGICDIIPSGLDICDENNLDYTVENTNLVIRFLSNEILKLDRSIQCNPPYVQGCRHTCTDLGYGENGRIPVVLSYPDGSEETCSIDYMTRI